LRVPRIRISSKKLKIRFSTLFKILLIFSVMHRVLPFCKMPK
jgi:hypothetical protein